VVLWAQAFNGAMLPISAIILLIGANQKKILGKYANNKVWNILGIAVIVVTIFLAARTMINVIPSLFG